MARRAKATSKTTTAKNTEKVEKVTDDYITSQEGIEKYEESKHEEESKISKKEVIDEVLLKDLKEGNIDAVSEHLQALIHNTSPDDLEKLKNLFAQNMLANTVKTGNKKDDQLSPDWRSGAYPYKNRMSRKNYEKQKYHLQVELLKLQKWVRDNGEKLVIVFEGRDAAGKGGTIKRFMEHLNPRGAKVIALEKPTEREQG
ncbi:MAG: polyphosphate kinase 2, partial [Candidatus Delongbacteria bacterium]